MENDAMNRFFRHFFTTARCIDRAFPDAAMDRIEAGVTAAELGTSGQIRIGIEASLPAIAVAAGYSARERAVDVFSQLRVWDTEHNNGVLIFLLMADKDVEIVADRGIDAKVGAAAWESICKEMEALFRNGEFEAGVTLGAQRIGDHLREHFPAQSSRNELPNRPYVYR
jgi:uncharacterized membrane protein